MAENIKIFWRYRIIRFFSSIFIVDFPRNKEGVAIMVEIVMKSWTIFCTENFVFRKTFQMEGYVDDVATFFGQN